MMGAVRDNLQQNLNYYLKANKMTQKKLSDLPTGPKVKILRISKP